MLNIDDVVKASHQDKVVEHLLGIVAVEPGQYWRGRTV